MRRVPGFGGIIIAQPYPVCVSEHGRALGTARPVLAGAIITPGEGRSVRLRTCKDVVLVWCIAAAVVVLAIIGQRGLFCVIFNIYVNLGHVHLNSYAFIIDPGTFADAIACIFRTSALCRQIGVPSL